MRGNGHMGKGRPAWDGALVPRATRPWRTALWVLRVAWITTKTPGRRPLALLGWLQPIGIPLLGCPRACVPLTAEDRVAVACAAGTCRWDAWKCATANAVRPCLADAPMSQRTRRPHHRAGLAVCPRPRMRTPATGKSLPVPPSPYRQNDGRHCARDRQRRWLRPGCRWEPCRAGRTQANAISRIASRRRHSVRLAQRSLHLTGCGARARAPTQHFEEACR